MECWSDGFYRNPILQYSNLFIQSRKELYGKFV